MKNLLLLIFMTTFFLYSCDIDQTQEGELPEIDVDVDAEAGKLPAFDIDWADVNVGTRTKTVKIPKVVVVMEEEEIEVPYIDVDMPNDEESEERTIVVEAEVSNEAHDLEIKEVYATGSRLYVVSELTPNGQDLGKERMRVSDRLVINAPDLDVKHYIVGTRPEGNFNEQYNYIANRSEINDKLNNGKQIYSEKLSSK